MYARILPDNGVRFTTLEEFKEYNPNGEDIQTNVNDDEVEEFDLRILKQDGKNVIKTDLVYPVDKASFCFDNDGNVRGVTGALKLIAQSSSGEAKDLKMSIDAGVKLIDGSFMNDEIKDKDITGYEDGNFIYDLNTDRIKEELEKGSLGKLEVDLNVEVYDTERKTFNKKFERTLIFTKSCSNDINLPEVKENLMVS